MRVLFKLSIMFLVILFCYAENVFSAVYLFNSNSNTGGGGVKRVNLTGATSDYFLQVDEEAVIEFQNQQYVPLRIATTDGTAYELTFITNGWATRFLPNNTSWYRQFSNVVRKSGYADLCEQWNCYFVKTTVSSSTQDFVDISGVPHKGYIWNINNNRRIVFQVYGIEIGTWRPRGFWEYLKYVSNSYLWRTSLWNNNNTPWTSLGTIVFSSPASGKIFVKRIQ